MSRGKYCPILTAMRSNTGAIAESFHHGRCGKDVRAANRNTIRISITPRATPMRPPSTTFGICRPRREEKPRFRKSPKILDRFIYAETP